MSIYFLKQGMKHKLKLFWVGAYLLDEPNQKLILYSKHGEYCLFIFMGMCIMQDLEDNLKKEIKLESHRTADAFILVILSHGSEGCVFGVDGKKVEIEEKILTYLDRTYFPAMIGKPKVAIVQACRGGNGCLET